MKHLSFLIFGALLAPVFQLHAAPPGTAFTYQGRLNEGGNPANGSYVFRFSLDDGNNASVGTPITTPAVNVSNGLFTVTLDFGPGVFTNAIRNLNLEVHTNDNGSSFVQLSPSQPILPTPYALFAETVDAAGIVGVVPAASLGGSYSNALNLTNPNNFYAGNGGSLTNVNAASLGGLTTSAFWHTTGNAGTTAGPNFLGTLDNQPLELRANGQRVLRLDSSGSVPNLIGGHAANSIAPGLSGVTIAGGGDAASFNSINSSWGTVSGGSGNTIAASASAGTISGGANNLVANNAGLSTINGGFGNIVSATHGAIGGGEQNWIKPLADHSTIGGGQANSVESQTSSIQGGIMNRIGTNSLSSVIGGGNQNAITNSAESVIGGGTRNRIVSGFGGRNFIGGGELNLITNGGWDTIGGGYGNVMSGDAMVSTIGGGIGNQITGIGSFIGNGGVSSVQRGPSGVNVIFGGENTVYGDISAIVGGANNTILSNANYSFIGGGAQNTIQTNAAYVTISGGQNNKVSAELSVIGGGQGNTNSGMAAVIGGGRNNLIEPTTNTLGVGAELGAGSVIAAGHGNSIGEGSTGSTISGGSVNKIMSLNLYSTIGGGADNTIEEMGGYNAGGGFYTLGSHVISGGRGNRIGFKGTYSAIAGGNQNSVKSNVFSAAIGGGYQNIVETNADFAIIPGGYGAVVRSSGQFAHAGGFIASIGDAQTSVYVLHGVTANASPTEIFLASVPLGSNTNRMKLPLNGAWSFDILIVATTSGNLQVAGYQIKGMVVRNGLGTAIVGTPAVTTFNGSTPSWATDVSAGSADGTLRIAVTGAVSTTIRWVASVRTTEVVY